MIIIPAMNVMKKKRDMRLNYGGETNLIQKQSFAVPVTMK
jgi:hypothetical protein